MNRTDIYEVLCDRLECELDEYFASHVENTQNMTLQDAEIIDIFLHSIKSVKTIMAMEGRDDSRGYSGNRYQHTYGSDHDTPMRNFGTRRESMRHDSRDNDKEEMMQKLNSMMHDVKTEDEAIALKSAMDALSRIK